MSAFPFERSPLRCFPIYHEQWLPGDRVLYRKVIAAQTDLVFTQSKGDLLSVLAVVGIDADGESSGRKGGGDMTVAVAEEAHVELVATSFE